MMSIDHIQQMIGVEDEDSCGKSGAGETPQAKPRRLHARPRKAKSSTEINCGNRANLRLVQLRRLAPRGHKLKWSKKAKNAFPAHSSYACRG
ncbi:hypothetical protein A6P54_18275 [Bacillus sp. MKU004]|nr:hypothetical protein A6P54_18275 [Bacillus sp. MKU004]